MLIQFIVKILISLFVSGSASGATPVDNSICQQVTILGDTLVEDDESFIIVASVASPDIISPTNVSVTIMDDDGMMKHLYLDLLLNNHIIV